MLYCNHTFYLASVNKGLAWYCILDKSYSYEWDIVIKLGTQGLYEDPCFYLCFYLDPFWCRSPLLKIVNSFFLTVTTVLRMSNCNKLGKKQFYMKNPA
jgi:hypothetical protein